MPYKMLVVVEFPGDSAESEAAFNALQEDVELMGDVISISPATVGDLNDFTPDIPGGEHLLIAPIDGD